MKVRQSNPFKHKIFTRLTLQYKILTGAEDAIFSSQCLFDSSTLGADLDLFIHQIHTKR